MTKFVEKLAACSTDTLGTELRAVLPQLSASGDPDAAVRDVAALLAADQARWRAGADCLITYLSENGSERVVLELLDVLVAAPEADVLKQDNQETLLAFFRAATTGIGAGGELKRYLKWGEQVLSAVFNTAEQMQDSCDDDKAGKREIVVGVAASLLQLRNTLVEKEASTPDLKIETFIWKNMAKLATSFCPLLSEATGSDTGPGFSADEAVAAVISSVEVCLEQMLREAKASAEAAVDPAVIKFFRLYWRAFQRLLAAFAGALSCELENTVLALVNASSCLVYLTGRHGPASKAAKDSLALLDQAIDLVGTLKSNVRDSESKALVRTLFRHPTTDMIRAVGQRQSCDVVSADVEASIRWGHLLLLVAYAGPDEANACDVEDDEWSGDSAKVLECSQLFARFRECTLSHSSLDVAAVTDVFTDLLLEFFIGFDSVMELQLTLLKLTLFPHWTQRIVCWELWRELLCYCWGETLATQALEMLLEITAWEDDSGKAFVLARGVDTGILQLISFAYAEMPVALQNVCLDRVTAVIDMISSEGPGHQFNSRVAAQLNLLESLADVQFLKSYDGPRKEDWISKYLPMCFECCGTVLELMASEANAEQETVLGMVRVLDMCLLVLKGIYDSQKHRQEEIAELSGILVRMATESLSQLATLPSPTAQSLDNQAAIASSSSAVKLERAARRCARRAIESSLYLLSKLGHLLKGNRNNQCVKVMKDLLAIMEASRQQKHLLRGLDVVVSTARFLKSTLSDVQVADSDKAVVRQMFVAIFQQLLVASNASSRQRRLQLLLSVTFDGLYELLACSNVAMQRTSLNALLRGELKQLFRESVVMRRLGQADAGNAVKTAQSSAMKSLRRHQAALYKAFREMFPEEPELFEKSDAGSENNATVATKRSASGADTLPQKRHKLTHFVSLCREIEASISSLGDDETATNLFTSKELEDATAVLRQLLSKTIALP